MSRRKKYLMSIGIYFKFWTLLFCREVLITEI